MLFRSLSLQAFASYEGRRIRGVGRPQKIDRQEMVGVVAAVNRWITMNHEDRLAVAERKCANMAAPLGNIPGVKVDMIDNIIGHQPYGVNLSVDAAVTGMTIQDVSAKLKEGDPPIWTRVRDGQDWITLHTFGLAEGEDKIVGARIAELFGK